MSEVSLHPLNRLTTLTNRDDQALVVVGSGQGSTADATETRTALGLGDSATQDAADLPVSTATQEALDGKADTNLGNVSGLTASEQDAFIDEIELTKVHLRPHLLGATGANFPSGPKTSFRLGVIGDSFGTRITPLQSILKPFAGRIREGGYNYSSAADDSSYSISPCSKVVTIQSGGTIDFANNGSAANCYGIKVVWLTEPGAGTITIKRKVDSGSWTTLHTESADTTLGADSFTENFVTGPSGGFSLDDCVKSNQIRIEASGGIVRGVTVEFKTKSAGFYFADLRATTGIDWDTQLASMDSDAAAALIAAMDLDILVYSFADDPDNAKWEEFLAALRTADPTIQVIVVGPHAIDTGHANYAYNEAAAKSCRRWCKDNGIPLLDVHAMVPSYDVGQDWGIFDGIDLVHTTKAGDQAIAQSLVDSFGLQRLLYPVPWGSPYNATGAQLAGPLEIVGNTGELRWYDTSSPTLSKYWRLFMASNILTWKYQNSSEAFYMAFTAAIFEFYPSNVNSNSRLGTSSKRWGEAWLKGLSVNLATSSTGSVANLGTQGHTLLCDATTGAFTQPLPAASGMLHRMLVIKKTDSSGNAVTIDPNGSETIDGATTYSLTTQYQSVMIQSDGSNWWILSTT